MQKTIARILTFLRYRELFFQLVSRDIKLKYRRSFLGYIWSMLNPLLTMLVMYIVFSNLFKFAIENFPLYLLIGQLLFGFMSGAISQSLTSVIGNAGLLKKIYVPKYIFTLSTVTSEFVTFLFSLGALIIIFIATKVPLSPRLFLLIIPMLQLYIFCIGLGLFMAQATVFFRDVIYIWSILSTAWLYLSAIFYPVSILPPWLYNIITKYNPMYFYITLFRDFTIGIPDTDVIDLIIRGTVAAAIAMLLGLVSFAHSKKKFILYM